MTKSLEKRTNNTEIKVLCSCGAIKLGERMWLTTEIDLELHAQLTEAYRKKGYRISTGLCPKCVDRYMRELK